MIPFGPFCAESVMNTISSRCRVVDQSTRHWGKWSVEPRSVGRESSWLPDPSSDQCRPISARRTQSAGTAGCSVENPRSKQNRAKFTISSSILCSSISYTLFSITLKQIYLERLQEGRRISITDIIEIWLEKNEECYISFNSNSLGLSSYSKELPLAMRKILYPCFH
jgi:hypothetical protein